MENGEVLDLSQLDEFEQSLKQLIIEGFVEVPILPEVAEKALTFAKNPDTSAVEMINLIRSDNYLTGQVLKVADSNEYTPTFKLISLQQAITRLGMDAISDILFSVVKSAKVFHIASYEDYVAKIHDHSLLTSLWAVEIARHLRGNIEVSGLVGRMHSIGCTAVLLSILDLAEQRQLDLSKDTVYTLKDKYCHQVTELVLARWSMPTRVISAIEYMHTHAGSHISMKIAETVNVAAAFASYMMEGNEDMRYQLYEIESLSLLNLYNSDVDNLLAMTTAIQQRLENTL